MNHPYLTNVVLNNDLNDPYIILYPHLPNSGGVFSQANGLVINFTCSIKHRNISRNIMEISQKTF